MIHNIHILINDDPPSPALLAQMAREERLILDHRCGRHPWGSMRRDCPLCQLGK